jgi:hypothetical protein
LAGGSAVQAAGSHASNQGEEFTGALLVDSKAKPIEAAALEGLSIFRPNMSK